VVRQLWTRSFRGAQVNLTIDDFDTSSDLGFMTCTLTLQPTPNGGPAATTEARGMFVMLRDFRGRWHIRSQSITFTR
jgi:ketosteroid isomerase-like protein